MATYFKRYLGLDEASQLTGLSRKEIVRGVQSGRFPSIRQGKFYMLSPVAIGMTLHAESCYETSEPEMPPVPELPEIEPEIQAEPAEQNATEPETLPAVVGEPSDVTAFTHDTFGTIRIVRQDGEPWFVAADVCKALDIANSRDALKRLDDDEKGVALTDTLGGKQEMATVSEPGLYALTLSSRKPEAKAFKRWVTHEVIPSIRKHGVYATEQVAEKMLNDPDFAIRLFGQIKEERDRNKALSAQNAALTEQVQRDAPAVEFAHSFKAAQDTISIGELAKLLKTRGYDTGEVRLFEQLREDGYLVKTGPERNLPTQQALSRRTPIFTIKETPFTDGNGVEKISRSTRVTPAGQIYFYRKYCGETYTKTGETAEEHAARVRASLEETGRKAAALRKEKAAEAARALESLRQNFPDNAPEDWYTAKQMGERFPIALGEYDVNLIGQAMRSAGYPERKRNGKPREYSFPSGELKAKPTQTQMEMDELGAAPPVPTLPKPAFIPAWHNAENDVRRILDEARANRDTVYKWQTTHEFITSHPALAGYLPHTIDMELTKLCLEAKIQYNRVYRNLPIGSRN